MILHKKGINTLTDCKTHYFLFLLTTSIFLKYRNINANHHYLFLCKNTHWPCFPLRGFPILSEHLSNINTLLSHSWVTHLFTQIPTNNTEYSLGYLILSVTANAIEIKSGLTRTNITLHSTRPMFFVYRKRLFHISSSSMLDNIKNSIFSLYF